MPATSEIEKLESRYAENPEGRYFAPLADAYRKVGRVDDAVQLVLEGLRKHPDYLSAHIVLGRCYLDQKDDVAAQQAFQTVLGLDVENIIALRSLAGIAERMGKTDDARQWLTKLLAVDSMNEEAQADLQRLGGPLAEAVEAPLPPPALAQAVPGFSFADLAITEAPTVPMTAIPEPALEAPAIQPQELPPEPAPAFFEPAAGEEAPTPAPEPTAASLWSAAPEVAEVDFGAEAAVGAEPSVELEPALAGNVPPLAAAPSPADLPLIMPEDVTPADEVARPSAKLVQIVSPHPAEEPAGGAGAPPMLTETMGDLYLKQGFRGEAAEVYRRLLVQRPDDAGLKAKLAQLEGPTPSLSAAALGTESLGVWLRRVALTQLPAPASASVPARDAERLAAGGAQSSSPSPPPGTSFDEFFGAPSAPQARAQPTDAAPRSDGVVGSFSTWLRGLKR